MSLEDKYSAVMRAVLDECDRARAKHGSFHSTHEAFAVILEELQEWWDTVKADKPDDAELISVAAMAILAIVELGGQNVNDEYIFPSPDED